jgi:hypothetical protein
MKLLPQLALNDMTNLSTGNAIFFPEVYFRNSSNRKSSSDFGDLKYVQFGATVLLSFWRPVSSFCAHIQSILSARSKPKMPRITTRTIIARMTNAHSFRNYSMRELPDDAMGAHVHALNYPSAVTFTRAASPTPALIKTASVNFLPKIAQLSFCQLDDRPRVGDLVRSFMHKLILYFEVRTRSADYTAPAFVFDTPRST